MKEIKLKNVNATVIKLGMHNDIENQIDIFTESPIYEYENTSKFDICLQKNERGSIIDNINRQGCISTSAVQDIIYDTKIENNRMIKFKTYNSYYLIIVDEEQK